MGVFVSAPNKAHTVYPPKDSCAELFSSPASADRALSPNHSVVGFKLHADKSPSRCTPQRVGPGDCERLQVGGQRRTVTRFSSVELYAEVGPLQGAEFLPALPRIPVVRSAADRVGRPAFAKASLAALGSGFLPDALQR